MKRLGGLAAGAALWWWFVRWSERWGTLPHEPDHPMPGDEMVPRPSMNATRATVIDAPPGEVYPWFAQMGPGRAGWYSYDWIDNGGAPSAREIHSEWVIETPGTSMGEMAGLEFVAVEAAPPSHLVIDLAQRSFLAFTLAYRFERWGETATRVVVRVRSRSTRARWLDPLIRGLLGPADFVMMRRQLLGVRERAERARTRSKAHGVA